MPFINANKLTSSFERAKLVSYFTDGSALLYHILIFFTFIFLKVKIMIFYNIFSIFIFSFILANIKKVKSFVGLYMLAIVEVVLHQILADYFVGSYTSFHYFILLMGLLPYMVFEDRFKITVPVSFVTIGLFIFLDLQNWPARYPVSLTTQTILRFINIGITIFVIIFMILIFTYIVYLIEKSLEHKNEILEQEIVMASVIQQNFFKQDISDVSQYKISYYSKPLAGVSGDIYDFYKTGSSLDGLGLFDVSGHGISSGLVTMLVKNIINQEFYDHPDLDLWEILNHINDRVIKEKGDIENYLTGILLRFNDDKTEIAIAGHPLPIIYHKKDDFCDFFKQKEPSEGVIGIDGLPAFFTSQNIDFEQGDEIVLYSDGICDILNSTGERFGNKRLLEIIKNFASDSVENQTKVITKAIEDFRGSTPQTDDITFIIIKK